MNVLVAGVDFRARFKLFRPGRRGAAQFLAPTVKSPAWPRFWSCAVDALSFSSNTWITILSAYPFSQRGSFLEELIPLSTARVASREELEQRAQAGETVVPGGTGGKSLEAQEHLAERRSRGGKTRANQLGHEGYAEMGKKGGLASNGADPDESAAAQDIDIDDTKFTYECCEGGAVVE